MKKYIHILIAVMILCILCTAVSFASSGSKSEKITYRSIGIYVNGTEIAPCDVNGNSTEPFIRNADGSTYLPVRAVAGALGLDVDWNESTSTVILESDGEVNTGSKSPVKTNKSETSTLYYRNITITLDGKKVELKNEQGNPVEPFIKNGTTYIPVRAVASSLGLDVNWNGNTNSIYIGAESKSEYESSYIRFYEPSLEIKVGDSQDIHLYAPTDCSQWSISNDNVISVSKWAGIFTITGKTAGTATVTAKNSYGKTAKCTVTVTPADTSIEPVSISLNQSSMSLYPGDSGTLSATVYPSDAKNKTVSWSTSKSSVATVSNSGKVTAKGAGTATITAKTSNGKTASCVVTVISEVTSVSLNKTSKTINVGTAFTLTATISPSDATDKTVSWTSSNTSVATVSNSGRVTAKRVGTATITAKTSNGKTASCTVTVVEAVEVMSISLNRSTMSLNVGDTGNLSATISPSDATDKAVSWSSSNTSVATVSSGGTVTAKAAGTATITAKTSNGKSASCTVTVTAVEAVEVTSISINKSSMSLNVGNTGTLSSTISPSNATDKTVTWSSSNTSVATVSSGGTVTAKAAGTATITARSVNGKTASCTVTVNNVSSGTSTNKYYSEFPSVPDFGAFTGVSLYQKSTVNSGTGYLYSLPALKEKYGTTYGIKEYEKELESKGFSYTRTSTLNDGSSAVVYNNYKTGVGVLISSVQTEDGAFAMIVVAPDKTYKSYSEFPTVPDFGSVTGETLFLKTSTSEGGIIYQYFASALDMKYGSDCGRTQYRKVLESFGFKYTNYFASGNMYEFKDYSNNRTVVFTTDIVQGKKIVDIMVYPFT